MHQLKNWSGAIYKSVRRSVYRLLADVFLVCFKIKRLQVSMTCVVVVKFAIFDYPHTEPFSSNIKWSLKLGSGLKRSHQQEKKSHSSLTRKLVHSIAFLWKHSKVFFFFAFQCAYMQNCIAFERVQRSPILMHTRSSGWLATSSTSLVVR